MRKTAIVLFALICTISYGQIRHVKGIKSLEIGAGTTKFGKETHISYVGFLSNKLYIKGGVFYEMGNSGNPIKYTAMGAEFSTLLTLVRIKENVYVNALGGVVGSMDRQTETSQSGIDMGKAIKVGVQGGGEIETFLADRISIIVFYKQRFLSNPAFGNYRWSAGLGLRYNF